jgi:hypothetical protein
MLVVAIQCGPTGPSRSVTGNWRFTRGKSLVYEMSLTQTGSSISGVACVYAVDVISRTPQEVPVTGDYPIVRFTDPFVANCTYDATFEEDRDQIAGDCGDRSLVRFNREGSGRCERPIR